eukprot:s1323_g1.t1
MTFSLYRNSRDGSLDGPWPRRDTSKKCPIAIKTSGVVMGLSMIRRPGQWSTEKPQGKGIELWLGTFHFTPGCNQIVYSEEVTGFLNKKPKDGLPVIVQGDANADVGWGCTEGQQMMAVGRECNSTLLLNSLALPDGPPPGPQGSPHK